MMPLPRPRKASTRAAQAGRPVYVVQEYSRCGALNLFAAFDIRMEHVYARTAERKRQAGFISFLTQLDRQIASHLTTVKCSIASTCAERCMAFSPARCQ